MTQLDMTSFSLMKMEGSAYVWMHERMQQPNVYASERQSEALCKNWAHWICWLVDAMGFWRNIRHSVFGIEAAWTCLLVYSALPWEYKTSHTNSRYIYFINDLPPRWVMPFRGSWGQYWNAFGLWSSCNVVTQNLLNLEVFVVVCDGTLRWIRSVTLPS